MADPQNESTWLREEREAEFTNDVCFTRLRRVVMSDRFEFRFECEECTDMFSAEVSLRVGYVILKNGDPGFPGYSRGEFYWGDVPEKEVVMMRAVLSEMVEVMEGKARDLHHMDYDEMVAVEGVGISMLAQLNGMAVEKGKEKKEKKEKDHKKDKHD